MNIASRETKSPTEDVRMMEIIVTRQNMRRAYNRVMANKGAPGVDGMTVGQLKSFLKRCWPKIKQYTGCNLDTCQLRNWRYRELLAYRSNFGVLVMKNALSLALALSLAFSGVVPGQAENTSRSGWCR